MPEAKTKNIYQKMLAVSAAVDRVPKTGRNEFHKYDYATEADILDAVRGHLVDNGLVVCPSIKSLKTSEVESVDRDGRMKKQQMRRAEMRFTIVNADNPEETIELVFWGEGLDAGDKGIYKAYTGGEKYFLTKTFMIPTGDDPEREEGAGTERPSSPEKPVAAPPLVAKKGANLAEDKGTTLDEYRARITNMLKDMSGNDAGKMEDMLASYTAFQGNDGKVHSRRTVDELSIGWARSTCHTIEKEYQKWIEEQIDGKGDAEVVKFLEDGGMP